VNESAVLGNTIPLADICMIVIDELLNHADVLINFVTVHSLPILWMEGLLALFTIRVRVIILGAWAPEQSVSRVLVTETH
jgi:hypothetical protein